MDKQEHNSGPAEFHPASFDRTVLDELRLFFEDDLTVVGIVEVFLSDTERRLPVLRGAGQTGDLATVRAQAHAVKGSAQNVGAHGLVGMCEQLELHSERMTPDRVEASIRQACAEFRTVCEELRLYIATLAAPG